MRQNADLILPFTSICLQKSAGEQEVHALNTNRTLHLHSENCLTLKYLIKCSVSRGKMTFRFTLRTARRSCETLPFHSNRFLSVFVMLTYRQSSQHGCCWCLRPRRINVMSNNSSQQSPVVTVKLFFLRLLAEPSRTRTKSAGLKAIIPPLRFEKSRFGTNYTIGKNLVVVLPHLA